MLPSLLLTLASSESQRHYHGGKLAKYEIGPPALLLSAADEARLKGGRSVLQTIVSEDGESRRMVMVQDIQAPSHIVLGRIMDIDKYPEMVSGVDSIETYASSNEKGQQIVKSTYEISALHMRFTYFVTHTYDPAQRCMVFHLDYDRKSDLDDTVGYWYVDQTGRSSSRVFYSCECTLRGWVPGPVYGMLTKEAVKKATTWVERESVKEYRASRSGFRFPSIPNNDAVKQFLDNMRETVASQRKAAADWVDDRRRAASRFASSLRPPPKASGAL